MSRIVTTKLGRFRAVRDGEKKWWLFECPDCKAWMNLSEAQMEGRASVYCEAPKQHHYPLAVYRCGYHQTHEYAKELVVTIQAAMLMGKSEAEVFQEDKDGPKPSLFMLDKDEKVVPWDGVLK